MTQVNSGLTEEESLACKKAFSIADGDGDGRISANELGSVMRSLGHHASERDLEQMMASADLDGDGKLDFAEFVAARSTWLRATEPELEAFRIYDRNGDGYISREELSEVLRRMGIVRSDEELDRMFRAVDENGDGGIDYAEFMKLM